MNNFMLVGHDNPFGTYPAPVVPIGKVNKNVVAIYRAGESQPNPEPLDEEASYVKYEVPLPDSLHAFNYCSDGLFAFSETNVVSFPLEHEREFLAEFLEREPAAGDPFVRLVLAKRTEDVVLIAIELSACCRRLRALAPSFAYDWCLSELWHLIKRVDLEHLSLDTTRVVQSEGGEVTPLVLIVDDNRDLVEIMALNFRKLGYAVATAYNGSEAMDQIRHQKPRLILLDIKMPKVDGLQVLELLKSDVELKNIPVIVLSGVAEEKKAALERGANVYMEKGATFENIAQQVQQQLKVS